MMPDRKFRPKLIGGALLALAFVAGAAAGVTVDRLLAPTLTIRARVSQDMSPVLDKLALTPPQRSQADAIIQRSAPRTEEAMLEIGERLRSVSDSIDAELRAILTTAQRARLDSLKRQPILMLKRKRPGSATTVDTVFPVPRDTGVQR
jgi:hypothetical protein